MVPVSGYSNNDMAGVSVMGLPDSSFDTNPPSSSKNRKPKGKKQMYDINGLPLKN
jgi:hypothetical protein